MKNSNIKFLEELTFEESKIISGGGVKEWGAKAKEWYCSAKEAVSDYFTNIKPSTNILGPTGNSYPM